MTEKTLAMLGIVLLFVGGFIAIAIANDSPQAITTIALNITVGVGTITTLWKLGTNTEKTDQVAKNINGLLDQRVSAAYREAYARGRNDGRAEEAARHAEATAKLVAETVVTAAKEGVAVVPQPKP